MVAGDRIFVILSPGLASSFLFIFVQYGKVGGEAAGMPKMRVAYLFFYVTFHVCNQFKFWIHYITLIPYRNEIRKVQK